MYISFCQRDKTRIQVMTNEINKWENAWAAMIIALVNLDAAKLRGGRCRMEALQVQKAFARLRKLDALFADSLNLWEQIFS